MQNWQSKTKTNAKTSNNISKMMAERDKNRLQEKKKKDFIELFKKPRSKEYMMFLKQKIELEKKIRDIEEQISDLEQDNSTFLNDEITPEIEKQELVSKAESSEPVSKWLETTEAVEEESIVQSPKWLETTEVVEESSVVPTWLESNIVEEKKSWVNEVVSHRNEIQQQMEKLERKKELQRQREELLQQWEEASRQFEAQLPVPEKTVGLVYWGAFSELLKRWGVVSVPGTSYHSPQQLLDIANPKSNAEAERWIKGDKALRRNDVIAVEIYMEVLCLIEESGEVTVVEE